MAVRGFRTKIALHIALLVLLSAIVTDVLVVLVAQGMLVRGRLSQQSHLMETVGRMVLDRASGGDGLPLEAQWIEKAYSLGDLGGSAILIVDQKGTTLYALTNEQYPANRLSAAALSAIQTNTAEYTNVGHTLAVFWWQAQDVLLAMPIHIDDQLAGAMVCVVPLSPLYAKLRQYNKPVFIYILLNTIILSVIGLYRIFRIYLRPIDRIVRQADEYGQYEDFFFTFRQEDDELNRLSSSLNRMLKRISEDKKKLQETVTSLEMANEELKKAQTEIIRAEKMASVGRLAAGIAHEIGNPIGIVLGYLDLLRQSDLNREEHDDFTLRAEKEIQRINTIIRRLLDLARPKETVPQLFSVHAAIEEIVEVMRHQPLMNAIRMEIALAADADKIWANADQLHQIFLNLLLNAADAIHGAGRISDGCITIGSSRQVDARHANKQWLIIDFQDNGAGIAADQIENIFDPFYTTKEPGKGTGLGLAVSYMIVEEMGGAISAQSTPGQGTTLTLRLPLRASAVAGPSDAGQPQGASQPMSPMP